MKKVNVVQVNSLKLTFLLILFSANMFAQPLSIQNPKVVKAELVKVSKPVATISNNPKDANVVVKKIKPGYHPKGDWPLHEKLNAQALPIKEDLGHQKKYNSDNSQRRVLQSWNGIGNTNVDPSDACLAVGPNHVVQMINGASGAYFKVYDKQGYIVKNTTYLDGITGMSGGGDPIVLFDQLADRWIMSEFSSIFYKLIIAVSVTNDPTGSFYVYSFDTPGFPDYPKYAVWPDAYYVTTNEAGDSPIYALDRNKMLAGDGSATMQRFTIPDYASIGFQAATPVTLDGTDLPPNGAPGMIMRMADDGWDSQIQADRLELFEFFVDFDNPGNSHLDGPEIIETEPFDTELCGYTGFSCIDQPGTYINLDPLREVLMYSVSYRNFGSHQSIVCNHVTDVDGNDRAGVRWYELRKQFSDWEIHQQSTYAPNDASSRWMAGISMNDEGSIGLAYNVSSGSVYPGIRYTGRTSCDPLSEMTITESSIKEGSSYNNSNRWGDYSCLTTDPSNGSFWFSGSYAQNGTWNTYISNFEVPYNCSGIMVEVENPVQTVCLGEPISFSIDLDYMGGSNGTTTIGIQNLPSGFEVTESVSSVTGPGTYVLSLNHENSIEYGQYVLDIIAISGEDTEIVPVQVIIENPIQQEVDLLYPSHNTTAMSYMTYFEWMTVDNASSYTIEISEDPSFQSMLSFEGMVTNNYTVLTALEENHTYFWRVNAINICGIDNYSETRSFTTGTAGCSELANSSEVQIPSSGTPTVYSTIVVPDGSAITSISIPSIEIEHTWISDLEIYLISPSGTQITLIDGLCYNQDNLNLGLSNDGLDQINIPCPPTTGQVYQPIQSFDELLNENAAGEWTLKVVDKYNMDGGKILDWELELCHMDSSPCHGVVSLDEGNISSGTYQANHILSANKVIPSNANVVLKAGSQIKLEEGFEVKPGAELLITIGDCNY